MKKRIALALILIPLLLCSCTSVNRLIELLDMKKDVDAQAKQHEAVQIELPDEAVEALEQQGFERVEASSSASSWSFTEYSLDELIEGLTNRTPMTDASGAPIAIMPNEDPDIPTADASAVTVPFSDEPWEEKGVEEVDITQYMTPEEKAELEAFNEEEMAAAMAEMETSMNDLVNSFGGEAVQTPEGTPDPEVGGELETPEVNIDDYTKQVEDAIKEAQDALGEFGLGDLFGGLDIGGIFGGLTP